MGHLMEKRGGEQEEKNNTFGGLDFDVCNPNNCLGGDTLTVIAYSLFCTLLGLALALLLTTLDKMNRTRPESAGEEVPDGDEDRSEKDFEAALVAIRELQHARLVMCKPGKAARLHYDPTARASSKSFSFPRKTSFSFPGKTGPTSKDIYSEDPTSKSFSFQVK